MSQKPENALRELRRGVYPAPDPSVEVERRERIGLRVVELQRELTKRGREVRRVNIGVLLAALVGGPVPSCCSFAPRPIRSVRCAPMRPKGHDW